ncbi:MAG: hypothetical protein F4069_03830 [Rhodothermaceae bacterium]|nr:hypothetical protein [Rhodothermaceae bacterium]MYG70308.1 hypothetical protein [Rhodothermaceae bacterium]MYJ44444.1 hypothetical protein [Rhodothermaceae bacterium]
MTEETLIGHFDADEVNRLNRELSGTEGIFPISKMGIVFNLKRESASLVYAFRINGTPDGDVVKFSKPEHAPKSGRELKLATPAHYRKGEHMDEGICDPQDGTQIMDVSPYVAKSMHAKLPHATIHNLSARFTMTSCGLPWIYCASVQPNRQSEFRRLKDLFHREYDYSAITAINDPSAFALQLGLDFLVTQDYSSCVKPNWIADEIRKRSSIQSELWDGTRSIDKAVQVFHGPVVYEDLSGVMNDLKDFGRSTGIYATFTKRTKYCEQAEYRFAISPFGMVQEDPIYMPVSKRLADLVGPTLFHKRSAT